jgi:hypothetical protein
MRVSTTSGSLRVTMTVGFLRLIKVHPREMRIRVPGALEFTKP